MMWILEDRPGQYRNKNKALRESRKLTRQSGHKHYAMFTHTWRNLEIAFCWTVRIWPGREQAMKDAIGSNGLNGVG